MELTVLAAVLAVAFFVAGVAWVVLAIRFKRYRTDVGLHESPWHGATEVLEINVLDPKNYTAEGQRRLVGLYALMALEIACGIALLVLLVQ